MPTQSLRHTIAATLSALTLCACYVPAPVDHARLSIDGNNALVLDGKEVKLAELSERIRQTKQGGTELVVKIEVIPSASMETVRNVVAAVSAAKARVAFATKSSK